MRREPGPGPGAGLAAPRLVRAAAAGGRDPDPVGEPGAGGVPPAARGPRGRAVRALEAAHDGRRGRDHGHGDLGARGRHAHHSQRPRAAPLLARRAAEPGERAARGDGDRGAATHDPGPGGRLHRAPAAPARGEAGDHGLGPGERALIAALARPDRAGRLVRGASLAAPGRPHPAAHRADAAHGPRSLLGRLIRAGEDLLRFLPQRRATRITRSWERPRSVAPSASATTYTR